MGAAQWDNKRIKVHGHTAEQPQFLFLCSSCLSAIGLAAGSNELSMLMLSYMLVSTSSAVMLPLVRRLSCSVWAFWVLAILPRRVSATKFPFFLVACSRQASCPQLGHKWEWAEPMDPIAEEVP
eukprot:5828664-Amphidinium_carterae.1